MAVGPEGACLVLSGEPPLFSHLRVQVMYVSHGDLCGCTHEQSQPRGGSPGRPSVVDTNSRHRWPGWAFRMRSMWRPFSSGHNAAT